MAATEAKPRKWLAREVAAFSDTELDKFLEERRLQCGVTVVEVEDPKNLPESFIQRLRDRARGSPSGIAHSRAVDLDQVNARLLDFAARSNTSSSLPPSPQALSPCGGESTKSPTPPEVSAVEYYDKLVLEGGRPLYPIQLLNVISKSPEDHRELLRPWQESTDNGVKWDVFWHQWASWRRFRHWQSQNRTAGYPYYPPPEGITAFDTFASEFRGSTSYVEGLERLFAYYKVTPTYQICQDPEQQDKMTTWVEYLAFSYSRYHRIFLRLEQETPVHELAWETLMGTGLLEASVTEEYLSNKECSFQYQRERDQAWLAVQSAEAALLSAQQNKDPRHGSCHGSTISNRGICTAQSRLNEAKKTLETIERRNKSITKFFTESLGFWDAEAKLACQNSRLQWILEQIPIIETETNEARTDGSSPNTVHVTRGTKRRHDLKDADISNEKTRKRQRRTSSQLNSSSDHITPLKYPDQVPTTRSNSRIKHPPSSSHPRGRRRDVASGDGNSKDILKGFSSELGDSEASKEGTLGGDNNDMRHWGVSSISKDARPPNQLRQKRNGEVSQPTVKSTIPRRSARIRAHQGPLEPVTDTTGLRRSARIRARQNSPETQLQSTSHKQKWR